MSRYDEDRDEIYEDDDGDHIEGVCACCGKPCTSITIDQGIGVTEYWGVIGRHRDMVEVSPCCEDEVIDAPEEEEVAA